MYLFQYPTKEIFQVSAKIRNKKIKKEKYFQIINILGTKTQTYGIQIDWLNKDSQKDGLFLWENILSQIKYN
jgi:hypothetical protein